MPSLLIICSIYLCLSVVNNDSQIFIVVRIYKNLVHEMMLYKSISDHIHFKRLVSFNIFLFFCELVLSAALLIFKQCITLLICPLLHFWLEM